MQTTIQNVLDDRTVPGDVCLGAEHVEGLPTAERPQQHVEGEDGGALLRELVDDVRVLARRDEAHEGAVLELGSCVFRRREVRGARVVCVVSG